MHGGHLDAIIDVALVLHNVVVGIVRHELARARLTDNIKKSSELQRA